MTSHQSILYKSQYMLYNDFKLYLLYLVYTVNSIINVL